MTVLCVIAHPDDECFMGGTLARLAAEQHVVYLGALADGERSRSTATTGAMYRRIERQRAAASALGCHVLDGPLFPDQRLDAVPLLDLTRVIEGWIQQVRPAVIYTHSPGDLNGDHRRVYDAVLPAARPKNGIRELYAFAGPRVITFTPTIFWSVTDQHLDQQREAMGYYGDELAGEFDLVQARAVGYGYLAGTRYAEGFEVIRSVT